MHAFPKPRNYYILLHEADIEQLLPVNLLKQADLIYIDCWGLFFIFIFPAYPQTHIAGRQVPVGVLVPLQDLCFSTTTLV